MNLTEIRNSDNFQIQGWMINQLGLKGNELLVYAIIYGFTRNPKAGSFYGTEDYISKWLQIDRHTAGRVLQNLTNKDYLKRAEHMTVTREGVPVKRALYETNLEILNILNISQTNLLN